MAVETTTAASATVAGAGVMESPPPTPAARSCFAKLISFVTVELFVPPPATTAAEAETEAGVTESPPPTPAAKSCFEKLRSIVNVEVVFFLHSVGTISFYSCLKQYVFDRISEEHHFIKDDDQDRCLANNHTQEYKVLAAMVEAESSRFTTLQSAVSLGPALVMTLFLGHYSDCAGRKIVMLPEIVSASIHAFLTILMAYYDVNIYYLLILTFLDALTGSSTITAAFAYMTDITSQGMLAFRLLMVNIAISGGMAIASTATGMAIKKFGYLITFLLPTAAHALNTVYVAFYLKETHETKERVRFFTVEHLKGWVRLLYPLGGSPKPLKLYFLLAFLALYIIVESGPDDLITFYLLGPPICFESDSLGTYNTFGTVVDFFGACAWAKFVLPKMGVTAMLVMCCVFGFLSKTVLGLIAATNRYVVYLVPFLCSITNLSMPITKAWGSIIVGPEHFGTFFAVLSFCSQVADFFGTITFNAIFSQTVGFYAGLVFFICALVYCINTVVTGCLHIMVKRERLSYELLENEEPSSVNANTA